MRDSESLSEVAAEGCECVPGAMRLEPFGDHVETQTMGEVDDALDDHPIGLVRQQPADEHCVDLQAVDRELPQRLERRIPGTEVVDGDRDAGLTEPIDREPRVLGIGPERPLGHLDFQARRREPDVGEHPEYER